MRNKDAPHFVVIEDPAAGRLLNRLKKGQLIRSRIVLKIGERHYALRIFGHNVFMESPLPLKRFDEIYIRVQKLRPKLILRLVQVQAASKNKSKNKRMNIIV